VQDFSDAPRFELLSDDTFYARAGVQTNCGGIAGVHLRITPSSSGAIVCRISDAGKSTQRDSSVVPGSALPPRFRDAVFAGAQTAFDSQSREIGVCFELIDALVHPVDANEVIFKIAGQSAMNAWFEWYAGRSRDQA
jgi:hypothetical protein